MASLHERPRKHGPSAWRLMYRIAGRQDGVTFNDEAEARRWHGVFQAQGDVRGLDLLRKAYADDEPDPVPAGPTVRELVEAYIAGRVITDGTRDGYAREARRDIYPHLGDLPASTLDLIHGPDIIAAWINTLAEQPLSGKTIANRHGLLSSALARGVRLGHLPGNPCTGQRLPRSVREAMVILDDDEWWRLHDAMREFWRPVPSLLIGTGLRWSEATALQVRDVDLAAGRLRVERAWKFHQVFTERRLGPPKSAEGRRVVPFGPSVAEVLAPLVEGRAPDDLVLRNTRGEVIRYSTFHGRAWSDAIDAANLPRRPRLHDLRHTYASRRLASGAVSIFTLARVLGHDPDMTTRIYGHLVPGALDAVAQAGEFTRPQEPVTDPPDAVEEGDAPPGTRP